MTTHKQRRVKRSSELIQDISNNLANKGIRVSIQALQLILDAYYEEKAKALSEGFTVVERGVGSTVLRFRRSNTFKNGVIPTVKVQFSLNKSLHVSVMYNICNSAEVRARILGAKLTPDELSLMRERCDYKVNKEGK